MLTLEPPELAFEDVVLKRQYVQDIRIINGEFTTFLTV